MKALFFSITLLLPVFLTAQDFNYVHYDTRDGLAGSTVYSMCQDKDGFMWFGTENGLSRYDGTHFKNFTVKDGLPDNEVLIIFGDSKGRVWIGTFSKEICYYYNGKIFNKFNDSLVRKINANRNVESIIEDGEHFLGFGFRSSIVIITPGDSVIKYNVEEISNTKSDQGSFYLLGNKIRLASLKAGIFDYNASWLQWSGRGIYKSVMFDLSKPKAYQQHVEISYDSSKKLATCLVVPGKLISFETKGNSLSYVNTDNGSWSVDA